jgi:hypothetical protein
MDNDLVFETIKQLREELAQLDHTIKQVEALAEGRFLRGRPPRAVAKVRHEAEKEAGRVRRRPRRRAKKDSGDNDG